MTNLLTRAESEGISELDLRFVADALIGLCVQDKERPIYTDEAIEARERRIHRGTSVGTAEDVAVKIEGSLLAKEVATVVAKTHLTKRQSQVFDLRLSGHTFEEIGQINQTSKQAAQNSFRQALVKVVQTFQAYRFSGISQVYDSESARRGFRRRRVG